MDVHEERVGKEVPQDLDILGDRKVQLEEGGCLWHNLRVLIVNAPGVQACETKHACQPAAAGAYLQAERPGRTKIESLSLEPPRRGA